MFVDPGGPTRTIAPPPCVRPWLVGFKRIYYLPWLSWNITDFCWSWSMTGQWPSVTWRRMSSLPSVLFLGMSSLKLPAEQHCNFTNLNVRRRNSGTLFRSLNLSGRKLTLKTELVWLIRESAWKITFWVRGFLDSSKPGTLWNPLGPGEK